ncbi:hypothetical protein K458DRAFT_388751 [Lentithecium fluviatile CBS 122367]|uniref:Uncharacterized protein n=1 Tax=Lentithecium fluviatile CBS 122367 TaxID=1168545 RepID=A0A6G1J1A0_9PLEO|nr:hypothetical protein K458DRAFT_388751 [Lentithecium fluviatile CBS 122367]
MSHPASSHQLLNLGSSELDFWEFCALDGCKEAALDFPCADSSSAPDSFSAAMPTACKTSRPTRRRAKTVGDFVMATTLASCVTNSFLLPEKRCLNGTWLCTLSVSGCVYGLQLGAPLLAYMTKDGPFRLAELHIKPNSSGVAIVEARSKQSRLRITTEEHFHSLFALSPEFLP